MEKLKDKDPGKLFGNFLSASGIDVDFAKKSAQDFIKLMSYYKCAIMEIETKFNVLNVEYSLEHDRNPINTIKTRLKSPQSIKEKLERQGLDYSVTTIEENIFDVAGVRVVCSFPADVYTLADAILKQDDVKLIKKKDYIENPKPNGYRSLHMIVEIPIFLANEKRAMKVEIQLRTIAMDFWASLEHQLRYKKDIDDSEDVSRELFECAEMSSKLDMRMDNLRKKLKKENE